MFLLWLLILLNIITVTNATENQNSVGSNGYVSTAALLSSFYFTEILVPILAWIFHKNFLHAACFDNLEIRTLTPSRSKNETNDNLKLLGDNPNHVQRFVKQKIVTVHLSSFLGKNHE